MDLSPGPCPLGFPLRWINALEPQEIRAEKERLGCLLPEFFLCCHCRLTVFIIQVSSSFFHNPLPSRNLYHFFSLLLQAVKESDLVGTFLAVQRLGLCSQCRDVSSIPGQGLRCHMLHGMEFWPCEPAFALRMSGRVIVQSIPREKSSNQTLISSVQRMVGTFLHVFLIELSPYRHGSRCVAGPLFPLISSSLSSFLPYPSILQSVVKSMEIPVLSTVLGG